MCGHRAWQVILRILFSKVHRDAVQQEVDFIFNQSTPINSFLFGRWVKQHLYLGNGRFDEGLNCEILISEDNRQCMTVEMDLY